MSLVLQIIKEEKQKIADFFREHLHNINLRKLSRNK